MRTPPIPSLHVEPNISPLSIRRMDLSMRHFTKVKMLANHAASTAISALAWLQFNRLIRGEKSTGLTIASRIRKYQDDLGYVLPTITPLPPYRTPPWMVRPLQVSFLLIGHKASSSMAEIHQALLNFKSTRFRFHFISTDESKQRGWCWTLLFRVPTDMYALTQ